MPLSHGCGSFTESFYIRNVVDEQIHRLTEGEMSSPGTVRINNLDGVNRVPCKRGCSARRRGAKRFMVVVLGVSSTYSVSC